MDQYSYKTVYANKATAEKNWVLVDAKDQVIGRLASQVARVLRGKNKTNYTPNTDMGDHVVIINAEKVKLTGEKLDKKVYRWHTQYPGGLKEVAARKVFETKPDKMIREAVLGMLPKNKLRKRLVKRLKVYLAEQHPHAAQQPERMEVH